MEGEKVDQFIREVHSDIIIRYNHIYRRRKYLKYNNKKLVTSFYLANAPLVFTKGQYAKGDKWIGSYFRVYHRRYGFKRSKKSTVLSMTIRMRIADGHFE